MSHRIVLIHAVPMAFDPIKCAFDEFWPEAEIVNLFDDSLSTDRAKLRWKYRRNGSFVHVFRFRGRDR